jgi:hypothetical protein
MENTSIAQQWIYVNHTENTSFSITVFTVRYLTIACVFIAVGMCLPVCCLGMGLQVPIY